MDKNADAFKTISEAADDLKLPQHVLRFWETRFPQIKPLKRAGGRRFYRPADIRLLAAIRKLLYDEGYTIRGVQRLLKEHGVKALQEDFTAPAPALLDDALPAPGHAEPEARNDARLADPSDAAGMPHRPETLRALLALITDCETILRAARPSHA